MIRYRLTCQKKHEFEVWFPSSEACDQQIQKKLVACPTCESTKVSKALMAPSVVTSERKSQRRKGAKKEPTPNAVVPVPSASAPSQMLSGPQREILQQLKAMRDKVLAEAEYVGPRFADEARKIHNEEAPGRGIYGEASAEEVEELVNEGIDIVPIPVLPDDHN
jgi:hypothetical protein